MGNSDKSSWDFKDEALFCLQAVSSVKHIVRVSFVESNGGFPDCNKINRIKALNSVLM